MAPINCCYGCVPPARNGYCHATCEKYLAEKAAHDKRKSELDRERRVSAAIYIARGDKVEKAMRKRRSGKR